MDSCPHDVRKRLFSRFGILFKHQSTGTTVERLAREDLRIIKASSLAPLSYFKVLMDIASEYGYWHSDYADFARRYSDPYVNVARLESLELEFMNIETKSPFKAK